MDLISISCPYNTLMSVSRVGSGKFNLKLETTLKMMSNVLSTWFLNISKNKSYERRAMFFGVEEVQNSTLMDVCSLPISSLNSRYPSNHPRVKMQLISIVGMG